MSTMLLSAAACSLLQVELPCHTHGSTLLPKLYTRPRALTEQGTDHINLKDWNLAAACSSALQVQKLSDGDAEETTRSLYNRNVSSSKLLDDKTV